MDYSPDDWVVLKISTGQELIYKVFGSWRGGYLDGDSWRLNSGIVSVEDNGPFYSFYGHSGSAYHCNKGCYGIRGIHNNGVLTRFVEAGAEVMPEDTDWINVIWNVRDPESMK